MRSRPDRRGAFTLIELLVVIGILAFLMALTGLAIATLSPSFKASNGADVAMGYALSSRQMAKRDGVQTGLRFIVTTSDGLCRQMQYIRQPDDFAVGWYVGLSTNSAQMARIQVPAGTPFLVSPGDYLELYNGGLVGRITAISGPQTANGIDEYVLTVSGPALPDVTANPPTPGVSPTNYRVIRQPQVIPGEADLNMPNGVVIDFNVRSWNPYAGGLSNPPPSQLIDTTNTYTYYDVLFGPSGAVIGKGTTGIIYFWVRRADNTGAPSNTSDPRQGSPRIITIQPKTGLIASYQIGPVGGDPYQFALDGKGGS